jgi:hypothetical protein
VNCFVHPRSSAVGLCVSCQRAVCPECVARDAPRVLCHNCSTRGALLGFEYRSNASIGAWPIVHVCTGIDPVTMRPKVAKGVIAVGNIAIGGLAIGGLACGLLTIGGASLGLLFALGGAAVGLGVSIGGFAVGSVAIGGAAIGLRCAMGGAAIGPAVIDSRRCDPAAVELIRQWVPFIALPPHCRF